MRNLFNTIGAVVYATLRSHTDPQEFRKTFDGRLTALAKAHSLALNPGEAELRQLIKDTLAPYSIDHDIKIEGPRIALTQEAAVALSLATHELATNAAKYGALSADAGSIRVAWSIEEKPDGPQFLLRWYESGGPPVRRPSHHGYGHKTMTRSVASAFDAAVKLDYLAEGLQCRMTAPFSRRLGSPVN